MTVSVLLVGHTKLKRDMLQNEFTLAGFDVFHAQNTHEALNCLKSENIQVLLAADQLPDASISEFIVHLEPWKQHVHMMLLADPQDTKIRHWLYAQGISLFSPDSYNLVQLRKQLTQQLATPRVRSFHFSAINLFDLIQILALSLREVHLYIAEPESAREGLLFFSNGEIKHAMLGDKTGEEAFHDVMQMQEGYFAEAELAPPECYSIQTRLNRLMIHSAMRKAQRENQTEQQSFSGVIHHIQLLDILQISSSAQQSYVIQIQDPLHNQQGSIVIHEGILEHACFNHLNGLTALKRILNVGVGQFHFEAYTPPEARTLEGPFTHYMLQLASYQDSLRPQEVA